MPRKKKKYNARFPPARIKKIMQGDEDVGKVAAAVPVIISRALELFIEALIVKSTEVTQWNNSRTLSASHIKQTVESDAKYSFLRGLVANVADIHSTDHDDKDVNQQQTRREVRPLGRPRKHRPAADVSRQSSVIDTWSDECTVTPAAGDVERRGQKRKTVELERLTDEPPSENDDTDSQATET